MITGLEVGSVFKLVNLFSPELVKILAQVRELNLVLDKAKANIASLGASFKSVGIGAAAGEVESLSVAWANVARNATAAQTAMGRAGRAATSAGGSGAGASVGAGGGRGGGRARLGARLGGGGGHVAGPGTPIPGGGYVRSGGAGMAAAGLLGYGVYEAAEMEDAVYQLIYHAGKEQNDTNRSMFRKILQDSMVSSGYGLKDIAESAKQEIRMFQGTSGGGIDVLPEMLRAATTEARLKGSKPEESMTALIGLAHMTKQYSPEAIKKLAPAFAFLSTANPSSLSSMERAAGYAVPLLQSGLDVDPMITLLLGTALTRAGATNTKSGTWLREMAVRAMPGTSLMSKMAYKKHEAALKELGLADAEGKPTWFTDGKPDLLKMLDIGGAGAAKVPVERRAALERSLFGAQGGGGFALLADPAVRDQVLKLRGEMNSPEFKNRYAGFQENYNAGSTAQNARTAMADFNVTMMEIGKDILPSVNKALGDFKAVLEGIRGVLPDAKNSGTVGSRALEGAAAGATIGALGGPGGIAGGTLVGGGLGGMLGLAEQYSKNNGQSQDKATTDEFVKALREAGSTGTAGKPAAVEAKLAPISLSLNIDGRMIAQSLSTAFAAMYGLPTGAPAADGIGQPYGGDHNFSSK